MTQTPAETAQRQALRLERYSLALYSYSLALALLFVGHAFGFINTAATVAIALATIAANAAVYLMLVSGFNLRFADPSLTKLQVYLGITLLMAALYYVDVARGISLGLCFLVFLFGIFRMSTRELMFVALYTLAAYALVINLLMRLRPESIANPKHEWFNWVLLAVSLPWFAVIGGRIREMRDRLRARKQELQEAIGTIQAMATRDEVTGLYNRAFFTESLRHALAQAERHGRSAALLFIDVDRFKLINDTLGHPVGDQALREIGTRLASCVRESDIVARLGGDEFVALIESVPAPDALQEVAQKIIDACARPLALERREVALSVSIGIAVMPQDGRDADTLMRNADIAMYRAKAQGRNCLRFYTRQMSEHAEERLELETELHQAAARGELRLHYQPKVAVRDGEIRGVEALVRWQHPRRGLLAPERFIDIAEDTGAIVPIGRWVLHEACRRAAAWARRGTRYSVAVNLSARQFSDPGLLDTVAAALAASGLDPALLELEITESMVMRDPDAAAGTMRRLRALGTRLSMDDFGTGYSSLGYLKRFPITTVKLDRSFVRDLPHREDDVAIARAVLAMAKSLRMDVTAEGVERADQLDFLRREGCAAYQGYYFSQPVAEEALLALLATGPSGQRPVIARG
ncbi:MAG TPA: EAL domain-containing protein [Burkholderiales bacterium]|nr:EAL domain-containing protein [Burkholderiales bacterium]